MEANPKKMPVFEHGEKSYVLVKEEVHGSCKGCEFFDTHKTFCFRPEGIKPSESCNKRDEALSIFKEVKFINGKSCIVSDRQGDELCGGCVFKGESYRECKLHPGPEFCVLVDNEIYVEIENIETQPIPEPKEVKEDKTNPQYYKDYPVETIDMMIAIFGKEAVRMHCLCTAFKYRMRLGKKDSIELDMAKEAWYLNKAKELE